MDIPIPSMNLMAIAPEILVLVTALLVMLADLMLSRAHKGRLAWLSMAVKQTTSAQCRSSSVRGRQFRSISR